MNIKQLTIENGQLTIIPFCHLKRGGETAELGAEKYWGVLNEINDSYLFIYLFIRINTPLFFTIVRIVSRYRPMKNNSSFFIKTACPSC